MKKSNGHHPESGSSHHLEAGGGIRCKGCSGIVEVPFCAARQSNKSNCPHLEAGSTGAGSLLPQGTVVLSSVTKKQQSNNSCPEAGVVAT